MGDMGITLKVLNLKKKHIYSKELTDRNLLNGATAAMNMLESISNCFNCDNGNDMDMQTL